MASAYLSSLGLLDFFGAVISAILFAAVIYILFQTNWVGLRVNRFRHIILKSDMPKEAATKAWENIQEHFFQGDDNDLKIAIIEADKLLEDALRNAGIRGTTLGDRLKNLKSSQVPNLEQVWQAHRLRNQIVHEPTFKLKRDLAEKALNIYKETLQLFGLLS